MVKIRKARNSRASYFERISPSHMIRILYEDNHIIAVYKPAGLLVQGDATGDKSLVDEVKKYLKEKHKKPGNVFLGLVHRLDRNVSGIVLFGKTSKGASRLSEQFRENKIKKIYYALVEGKIEPANGGLVHYLKKDEARRIALVSNTFVPGYDESELYYETVKSSHDYSLIKIKLKTGRFHQIRAQLSAIGHPVAGDKKYGGKSVNSNISLALSATEVEFKTAVGDEVKNLKIDYPEEWNEFFK